ncbi:hypothetical protein CFP71_13365 [Amycolatopsis thailandensis]|uniref:Uncharacterized protein n=1 Tax=Amycolatopsis thailandensis TaxID=589330 RepID=A0A229SBX0_9PSEU|nr:hypothetical protein [Amycolatopsis thailandensis]OXM56412.1 hypothetical protein CFP71_13365 [Amycolatopsis thailandensis]
MTRNRHVVDTDVVEFVRLGHRVSLNFTVPLRNRPTFDRVMATAQGGNNFDPDLVASTIGTLYDESMEVLFGAEGSAVLYIEVPYFSSQRLDSTSVDSGEKYTADQRQDYARRVIDWARRMRADEITVQQNPVTEYPVVGQPGEHPYRIRIWWD